MLGFGRGKRKREIWLLTTNFILDLVSVLCICEHLIAFIQH
jgi:hypothetical protein